MEKENQKYKEEYQLQKKRFIKLFQEMLDFISADYEKDREDFDYLQAEVTVNFPFYSNILIHLSVRMWSVDETYPELLEGMRNIYNKLAKDYKNYEQHMAEYNEEEDEFSILDDQ